MACHDELSVDQVQKEVTRVAVGESPAEDRPYPEHL